MKFESIVLVIALTLIVAFAAFGCASAPPTNSVIVQCLPLKDWSGADQDTLRAEYDALAPAAKMRIAFKDYVSMRDADKACLSSK